MASVPQPEPEPEPIFFEYLPVLDLRGLTQEELYRLSRCTRNPSRHDSEFEAVDPKIDPSIFNESAGSRKQTFSRVRFAYDAASRRRTPISRRAETLESESDLEKEPDPQMVEIFKKLFGTETNNSGNEEQIPGNAESLGGSDSPK